MANQAYIIGDVPRTSVQLQADVQEILRHPIFRSALTSFLNSSGEVVVVARGDEQSEIPSLSIALWIGTAWETGTAERSIIIQHGHVLHLAWFFDSAIAHLLAIKYQAQLFDDGCGKMEVTPPIDCSPYANRRSLRLLDELELQGHPVLRQFLDESRGLVI